jgi:hypothetical protein
MESGVRWSRSHFDRVALLVVGVGLRGRLAHELYWPLQALALNVAFPRKALFVLTAYDLRGTALAAYRRRRRR